MFAYNLLRIMGQENLREDDAPIRSNVKRRHIRTVIQTSFTWRRGSSAMRVEYLNFGSNSPRFFTVQRIYQALPKHLNRNSTISGKQKEWLISVGKKGHIWKATFTETRK